MLTSSAVPRIKTSQPIKSLYLNQCQQYKKASNSSFSAATTKMEADPCLQSISIPMDYDQFDPFDGVCMDAVLLCDDDDMFTSLDEAQLPSTCDVAIKESPQQENSAATEQAHDFQELGLTDLLLMNADAIESQNWQLASNLISRLEHLLYNLENEGSPFVRLAYLFTLGLRSRVTGNRPAPQVMTCQCIRWCRSYCRF